MMSCDLLSNPNQQTTETTGVYLTINMDNTTNTTIDDSLNERLRHIYSLSMDSDNFDGTYEEWLEGVRGPQGIPSEDGREVVFRVVYKEVNNGFRKAGPKQLKIANSYRIKLGLQDIYHHAKDNDTVERLLMKSWGRAVRSRLTPVKVFVKTIKYTCIGIFIFFEIRLTKESWEAPTASYDLHKTERKDIAM